MPAFEVLGPLQISLGRMMGDITRFLVLFTLVMFAFMVGLHNLYWYYGSQTYKVILEEDGDKVEKYIHSSEAFQGLPHTLFSLFWSMFGLVQVDSVEITFPEKKKKDVYKNSFPFGNHPTSVVEGVGMFLFAIYHVSVMIVLINMLIAMMSHSFEDIQGDCDVEWKFARTRLWMNYIDEGSTLPVPFNMIPTPKSFRYAWKGFRELLCCTDEKSDKNYEANKKQTFIKIRRENVCQSLNIEALETNYADILQRLVRRYLFKLERQKEEGKDAVSLGPENILGTTAELLSTTAPVDPVFAEESEQEGQHTHLTPPSQGNSLSPSQNGFRRKLSMRHAPASSRNLKNRRPSLAPNNPQVQLLSIPQLDAIQRSLKLLDVRLQHIQSKTKDDEKTKDDIEHIRRVMSENQKALSTVVTVLSSIQEEVRTLSIAIHKQHQNTLTIHPPSIRKRSNHGEHKDRTNSTVSIDRQTERERNRDINSVLNMDISEV